MNSLFSGRENFDHIPEKEENKSKEVIDLEVENSSKDLEIVSNEVSNTNIVSEDLDTDVEELEELLEDTQNNDKDTLAVERLYKKMTRLSNKYLTSLPELDKEVSVETFKELDGDDYYDFRTASIEGAKEFLGTMNDKGKNLLDKIIEYLEKFYNFMVEMFKKLTMKKKKQLNDLEAMGEPENPTVEFENNYFPTQSDTLEVDDVLRHLYTAEAILIPVNNFIMNFIKKNAGLHSDRFPDLADALEEHLVKVKDFSPEIGRMEAKYNKQTRKFEVGHEDMKNFKPTSKISIPSKEDIKKVIMTLDGAVNNTESNSLNTNKRLTILLKGKNYMGNASRMKYDGRAIAANIGGIIDYMIQIERTVNKEVNRYIDFCIEQGKE